MASDGLTLSEALVMQVPFVVGVVVGVEVVSPVACSLVVDEVGVPPVA